MKTIRLSALALGAMLLVGCSGSTPQPKTIDQIANATFEDSVSYYFGQQSSMDFWRMTFQDSTLKTDAAKAAYLQGLAKGMTMLGDNEAFNHGLMAGLQMAASINNIKENYETQLSADSYLAGVAYGMQSDTIIKPHLVQQEMAPLGQRLEAKRYAKEKAEADAKIVKEMEKSGYQQDTTGLVYKVIAPVQGQKLEKGQMVLVELKMTDVDGKSLVPSDINPMPVKVGEYRYSPIVNEVLPIMSVGAIYKVLGSAPDLFGPQARQFRLKGSDIACLEIKVVGYCDKDGNPTDAPVVVASEPVKIGK